jgi:hypothetical protein
MKIDTSLSPAEPQQVTTTECAPGRRAMIGPIRPSEWWIVVNIYVAVIVLLAVAGSALDVV